MHRNRRRFVTATAAVGLAGFAGCLSRFDMSGGEPAPDPVDLSGGKFDDDHGMEIGPHGGANGQIFYADRTPPDREGGPFWFHTLVFSLFPFYFDRRNRGWEATVTYVTDFSSVEYTVQVRDGAPRMPSPTAPETFGDATDLTYVVESEVMGGMGPGLHPFSDADDAEAFVSEHGGELLDYEEITPTLVEQLQENGGHHHHDSRGEPRRV